MLGINERDDSPQGFEVTIKHVKLCLDIAEAKAKGKHIPFSFEKVSLCFSQLTQPSFYFCCSIF